MQRETRRAFLGLVACSLGMGATSALAASPHPGGGSSEGFAVDADTKERCATCQFWGGRRRVTVDGKTVLAESLGVCNNPASHNHQKVTTPETGPMPRSKKWEALTVAR
ncbi:MAG: hypothetical protein OZ948_04385 [Deltaproteobacteria bacterium]|nr:hypothetical protein [Deltaproteobacteria bacterium]